MSPYPPSSHHVDVNEPPCPSKRTVLISTIERHVDVNEPPCPSKRTVLISTIERHVDVNYRVAQDKPPCRVFLVYLSRLP